jgi:hypothetical protein
MLTIKVVVSNQKTPPPRSTKHCLQRKALIRKKEEHSCKMLLDHGLRPYGSGGYNWDQDDHEEDVDEYEVCENDEEDEDEDEEMGDWLWMSSVL